MSDVARSLAWQQAPRPSGVTDAAWSLARQVVFAEVTEMSDLLSWCVSQGFSERDAVEAATSEEFRQHCVSLKAARDAVRIAGARTLEDARAAVIRAILSGVEEFRKRLRPTASNTDTLEMVTAAKNLVAMLATILPQEKPKKKRRGKSEDDGDEVDDAPQNDEGRVDSGLDATAQALLAAAQRAIF
jgi:hypothetical protein